MKKAIAFMLIFATLLITSSCDSAFVDESSVNMSQPEQKTENDINKNDHSTSEKEESNDNENSDASIENSSGSSSEIDLVKGRPVYATWAEYVSEHKTPLVGKNIADFGKISEVVEILLVHPHKDHVVLSTPNSAIFIYPLSEEEAQNKKPCIFYLEKEYAFDTFGDCYAFKACAKFKSTCPYTRQSVR